MGLLHRVLSRLVEILNNKEVGLRLNENGDPICYYCGRPLDDGPNTHLEHVYPRSAGGVGAARNFVWSCKRCNLEKHTKHPLTWIANKDLPDDIALDFIARLLIGVYFSYRRQRPYSTPNRWRCYDARRSQYIPSRSYSLSFVLPSFPLGEGVELQEHCPECGCAGVTADLPKVIFVHTRCQACGWADTFEVASLEP